MKNMLGNADNGAVCHQAFDGEVEQIASMTVEEVDNDLRRMGIEPPKTLPARLHNLLADERRRASAVTVRRPFSGSYQRYVPSLIGVASFIVSLGYVSKLAMNEELIMICMISLLLGLSAELVLVKPPTRSRARQLLTRALICAWILIVTFALPFPLAGAQGCCQRIVIVDTSTLKARSDTSQSRPKKLFSALDREMDGLESFILSSCQGRWLEVWATSPSQPVVLAMYQPTPPRNFFDIKGRVALWEARRDFFNKLGGAYENTDPNKLASVSNLYTALDLALSRMEEGRTRRLVVVTDSKETSDPFIRNPLSYAWAKAGRIDNENVFIMIYDMGVTDSAQASNIQEKLALLFTHPELVSVKGRLPIDSPVVVGPS